MGNQIYISRVAERFSSNTQVHSNPRGASSSGDREALRERLIAAALEVLAEGSDPCLAESRTLV